MNIVILGPAGSGKGTQAKKLAEKFGLFHLDMGNILRQAAKLDTDLGREINEIIHVKKELVPSSIAKKVLHLELASVPIKQGIVFDGVPRNFDQAEYFKEALADLGRKITQVFWIKISEEEGIRRISKRVFCVKCKAGFVLGQDVQDLNSQCPICESALAQRDDDTESGVKKRFNVFQKETFPVVENYKKEGILEEINGEKEPEEVFENILEKLKR